MFHDEHKRKTSTRFSELKLLFSFHFLCRQTWKQRDTSSGLFRAKWYPVLNDTPTWFARSKTSLLCIVRPITSLKNKGKRWIETHEYVTIEIWANSLRGILGGPKLSNLRYKVGKLPNSMEEEKSKQIFKSGIIKILTSVFISYHTHRVHLPFIKSFKCSTLNIILVTFEIKEP